MTKDSKNAESKDKAAKLLFSDKAITVALLNYYFFNGEAVIEEEGVLSLPTESVTKEGKETDSRLRDLLYSVKVRVEDKEETILLGIEHQSRPDYFMPQRIVEYNALEGGKQRRRLKNNHPLNFVITLVFYTGERRWNYKKNLYSITNPSSIFKPYLDRCEPDREILLIDPRRMSEEEIDKVAHPLKALFLCMKYQNDGKRFAKIISRPEMNNLSEEVRNAIKVFTGFNIDDILKEEGTDNMCSAMDAIRRDFKKEGRIEGSINAFYLSVKGAIDNFGVSAEKAMDAFNVPSKDRKAVLKRLNS